MNSSLALPPPANPGPAKGGPCSTGSWSFPCQSLPAAPGFSQATNLARVRVRQPRRWLPLEGSPRLEARAVLRGLPVARSAGARSRVGCSNPLHRGDVARKISSNTCRAGHRSAQTKVRNILDTTEGAPGPSIRRGTSSRCSLATSPFYRSAPGFTGRCRDAGGQVSQRTDRSAEAINIGNGAAGQQM